jgi:hypothetical protein
MCAVYSQFLKIKTSGQVKICLFGFFDDFFLFLVRRKAGSYSIIAEGFLKKDICAFTKTNISHPFKNEGDIKFRQLHIITVYSNFPILFSYQYYFFNQSK